MTGVVEDSFGKTKDGKDVKRYTLTNTNGVRVQLITYGAIVSSIQTPDRNGCVEEITFGYDDINGYLDDPVFMGATMGRVCGRITNAEYMMDGHKHTLPRNNGPHHIHGGFKGFSRSLWSGEIHGSKVTMTLVSPDGDDGYPGELTTHLTFELTEENELCLKCVATTTKPTPVNLTHHPYFNLSLKTDENVLNHKMQILGDKYAALNEDVLPTGELVTVEGTPLDLREAKLLSECITRANNGEGYDNCYLVNKSPDKPSSEKQLAARVEHAGSGRYMEVYTTKPGLNVYTAHYAIGLTERGGHVIGKYGSVSLETEHFPDSVNHPNFPSVFIRPGHNYVHSCSYKFGVL